MRHDLPTDRWRRSSRSSAASGNCLETQTTDDALIAVGDSKARDHGALVFPPVAWTAFLSRTGIGIPPDPPSGLPRDHHRGRSAPGERGPAGTG
ncbi:DUF397 domain-containing protein [Streptomyces sp. ST2-7A]|uniref:DUF397 domain-containing protein n=1 Tax=Streptomyces sp. ST2-7A TaxID=2907214 RepID=UPI001F37E78B|nr:DUF397 domain-containing protein [Streptomyces sp. ST2-7A]MCE7082408.1 DUF397 domain-containing protein [Streptomyces sp. ST2-7A]